MRFSPDGTKILYYRMPNTAAVDNNAYGTYELVCADTDGGHAVSYGKRFSWASWGPGGKQLACLASDGVHIVDIATGKVVRQLPNVAGRGRVGASFSSSFGRPTGNGLWARPTN